METCLDFSIYANYSHRPFKRKKYFPLCGSIACVGGDRERMILKKNVPKNAVICPDCHCALKWVTEEEYKKYRNVYNARIKRVKS